MTEAVRKLISDAPNILSVAWNNEKRGNGKIPLPREVLIGCYF